LVFNTALGWVSLWTNTDASFSTGVGAGTLFNNNGADNTAVGAAALFFNTTALTTQPLERMRLGTTLPTGTQPLALLRSSPTPPGVPWKQGFSVFLTLVLTRPSVSAR